MVLLDEEFIMMYKVYYTDEKILFGSDDQKVKCMMGFCFIF